MNRDLLLLLTSTAFGGFISTLISFYQWRVKSKHDSDKEERKRLYDDVKYYHTKYRDDEDEIDHLKDEIRKLKAEQINETKKRR